MSWQSGGYLQLRPGSVLLNGIRLLWHIVGQTSQEEVCAGEYLLIPRTVIALQPVAVDLSAS